MKKILLLVVLCMSQLSFAYKAKSEDLTKYSVEAYNQNIQKAITDAGITFDKIGEISETPNLGYYNFAEVLKDGKVVAHIGLTHVKAYNKHEALITVISPGGKLLGFSLPDANEKHENVHDKDWISRYLGKDIESLPFDTLAGSTFHANSVNAELRNTLRAFQMKMEPPKK